MKLTMERREFAKSVLLALLSVSAAVLLFFTIRNEVAFLRLFEPGKPPSGQGEFTPASPLYLVVSEGGKRLLLYDETGLSAYFDRVSSLLGETVGSAKEVESASEETFKQALAGTGILLGFGGQMPLSALAAEDGAVSALTAETIFLAAEESGVVLYGKDSTAGTIFAAQTGLSRQALELGEPVSGIACRFALEEEAFAFLPPETPIAALAPAGRKLYAQPLLTGAAQNQWIQTALSAFAADPYTARGYPDGKSGRVYPSEYGSIRFGDDGTVSFAAFDQGGLPLSVLSPGLGAASAKQAAVREALTGAMALLSPFSAQAEGLSFRLLSIHAEGSTIALSLGYTAGGRPVLRENGSLLFAFIWIENGMLTRAELLPLSGRTEEAAPLPPYALSTLAAALSEGVEPGQPYLFLPAFLQQESDVFSLNWCLVPIVQGRKEAIVWNGGG